VTGRACVSARPSLSMSDIVRDGAQVPWVRNLTIDTQDLGSGSDTTTPNAPEPVIDGGSF
jgi:hypothetical protein